MKKNKPFRESGYNSLKKILLTMRIAVILMILGILQARANDAYSQKTRLSLNFSETELVKVLDKIESESDFYFLYNEKLLNPERKVTIDVKDQLIGVILDDLFIGTDVKYTIIGRKIILAPSYLSADLQQKVVTGRVTDTRTGEPMAGVNIQVKGTALGAISDEKGNFSLTPAEPNATLVFSFIGYISQEIPLEGKIAINVALNSNVLEIDEVVVIGYGTQKRANVIGSVTSISGASIQSIPAVNVSNAIAGRLPGSVIIQQSGEPGQQTSRILVRGRTTLGSSTGPLVIIDGISGRSMDEIDPIDISSISVLKDASAAIYGASAANGVILITTKNGTVGKPKLNYQFYQGFMQPTVIPKMCNSGDYATMLSEYQDQNGKLRSYSDKDIELFYSGEDPWEHPNSNWFGDLVSNWTKMGKHTLTLDGGGINGMTYYLSLGFKRDEGMYKQASTRYDQYNIRTKIDVPITDWLKTSYSFVGMQAVRRYPPATGASIVFNATRIRPTQHSFWPNGLPGPGNETGDSPIVTSSLEAGTDETKDFTTQNTISVTITPPFIKGLALNTAFDYDVTNQNRDFFEKPRIIYYPNFALATRDPATGFITDMPLTPMPRGIPYPRLTDEHTQDIGMTGNININYAKKFGNHSFSVFGGYEQYSTNLSFFNAYRTYYITDVVRTLDAGGDLEKTNSGRKSIYARESFIGRATYDYHGKYLLEILFRRDGSLKFPKESRWGNFPGLLLGWRASEESFWKNNLLFINYFKLRASYGKMGMDPGAMWQYINKYNLSTGALIGDSKLLTTSVVQAGVANPFITWEKQTTQNVGFDSKWFNDMFHLNAEFFYNKRSDILAPRDASVPSFTGLSLPDQNIARVDNKGFEIDAGYHKSFSTDFSIDLTGNFSFNRNKVVFMDEPERTVPWQVRTGHPYGAILMYNAIGIFKDQVAVDAYPHWSDAKPGDVIFEDVNKDGAITSDDKILLDKADAPETYYGVTLNISFKGFSLAVLAQGAGKYFRMNTPDERRGEDGNYFQWAFDNRWTPTNTVTDVARSYDRTSYYWAQVNQNSTYWYFNMAYCRLKNLVLTYNIPTNLYKRLGISKASVSLSGNDLVLIWAAQRWYDPEIGDPSIYPTMRTFAIGANISF